MLMVVVPAMVPSAFLALCFLGHACAWHHSRHHNHQHHHQALRQQRQAPVNNIPQSLANASMPLTPQGDKVEKGTKSRYENRYEGYEGNWSTEYRTHEYPEDSKGLHHLPSTAPMSIRK